MRLGTLGPKPYALNPKPYTLNPEHLTPGESTIVRVIHAEAGTQ